MALGPHDSNGKKNGGKEAVPSVSQGNSSSPRLSSVAVVGAPVWVKEQKQLCTFIPSGPPDEMKCCTYYLLPGIHL